MTKKDQKKEVAAAINTAVVAGGINFAEDAGKGIENADQDSFAIPFLGILQPLSPAVDEIPGAKAGMFINTVTKDLFDKAIIIPCAFQRRWVRWAARETGGGFKGEHTPSQVNDMREKGLVKELDGRLYFPEQDGSVNPKKSDRLADTRNHYVLLATGPNAPFGVPAVFALTSSGIKVSKNFISRIDSRKIEVGEGKHVTAPSFSMVYEVTSEKKTNEKGMWWLPVISPMAEVTNPNLYAQAKKFYQDVTADRVKAAHETALNPDGGSNDDESGRF